MAALQASSEFRFIKQERFKSDDSKAFSKGKLDKIDYIQRVNREREREWKREKESKIEREGVSKIYIFMVKKSAK